MEMGSGTKRRKKRKNVKEEEKMTELSPASKTTSHGEDDHDYCGACFDLAARASLSPPASLRRL